MKKEEASSYNNSFGTASVILGILSIVFSSATGIILGIIALVFSSKQKKIFKNKWSKAGFILGLIGIILGLLVLVFGIIYLYANGSGLFSQLQQLQNAQ